jgi:hypothetical protein
MFAAQPERASAAACVESRHPAVDGITPSCWTTFRRVDLIDADARIRLAMQARRALTSALFPVGA